MTKRIYRQTKSGTWHLLYINRANCSIYKDLNWKNEEKVEEKDLPENAKICKKCFANNQ